MLIFPCIMSSRIAHTIARLDSSLHVYFLKMYLYFMQFKLYIWSKYCFYAYD
uniref:Uncharacterized protein n=1 Tax=Arundo donax TaxID=35708 RepID=A0A0A9EUF8_ARUDO